MSRVSHIEREQLDEDGRRIHDRILATRGSIAGPFRVWLHSPEFTHRATQLGEFLRYHTSLSPRLSELVILITACVTKSPVARAIHEPLARAAGLPEEVIAALASDTAPGFHDPVESAVHDYCAQILRQHTADAETLHRVVDAFGAKTAVEITGLCGYYTMVSMTLNAFDLSKD